MQLACSNPEAGHQILLRNFCTATNCWGLLPCFYLDKELDAGPWAQAMWRQVTKNLHIYRTYVSLWPRVRCIWVYRANRLQVPLFVLVWKYQNLSGSNSCQRQRLDLVAWYPCGWCHVYEQPPGPKQDKRWRIWIAVLWIFYAVWVIKIGHHLSLGP